MQAARMMFIPAKMNSYMITPFKLRSDLFGSSLTYTLEAWPLVSVHCGSFGFVYWDVVGLERVDEVFEHLHELHDEVE